MCDCRHCGHYASCELGSSCPNDICPACEQERDDARADEAAEAEADNAAQFFDRR